MVRRPKPDESESERQNESAQKVETIARSIPQSAENESAEV